MKNILTNFFVISVLALALIISGCNESDTGTGSPTTTGTGLFKTSGTMSFSSNRGNFTAQGIFDTTFMNTSASGGFKYTERGRSVYMVFAYNVVSQTNVQFAFAGVVDTAGTTTAGTYSYSGGAGSKIAFFGYIPNAADTATNSAYYELATGSIVVSSLSDSNITGSFSGSGINANSPSQTITVTNGSFNTPVVNYFFDFEGGNAAPVQEKLKMIAKKQLQFK